MRHGKLAVRELVFAVPESMKSPKATVTIAGKAVKAAVTKTGDEVQVKLAQKTTVPEGSAIAVALV